ncbi:MAG: CarD family transcriptional regulator [Methylocystis sp.]
MASKKPPVKAKKASAAKSRGKSGKSTAKSAAKTQRAHVAKSSAPRSKPTTAAKTKTASVRKKASDAARSTLKKAAAQKAAARKLGAQKAAAKKAAAARASAAAKAQAKKAAATKAASRKAVAAKAKTSARSKAAVATESSVKKTAVVKKTEAQAAPALKATSVAAPAAKAKPTAAKIPPITQGIVTASVGAAVEAARKAKAATAPAPSAPLRAGPEQKRPIASESARASMNLSQTPRADAVPKPASPVLTGAITPAALKPIVAPKPRPSSQKLGFKLSEFIVYPAHGVGQIVGIEVQEVAGFSLELFVVSFIKDKMILKVPTSKVAAVGMRKLSEGDTVERALATLSGRARIKRTMWSRRAQEYEAKINSGDLVTIAEVVRDLYRSDTQPEQSYSERQLYEAALDRMSREVSAVRKLLDSESLKVIESYLAKGPRRGVKNEPDAAGEEADVERAA